mmetsp:Transcript_19934/g.25872  ORF Transcript_19934/g.25872 Transcript_19934/m.25872 type:complete len:206 (-) Transcript_19934:240-857(-)|eukprot:CAMPEP_0184014162 /NCGR_PEP_ID=MMETSP0954-20121128/5474_1 /TAXON_ID=627963 /ORGANISM="Aplanochytrium sp, Strain PBS07" /LENGTH=205 /DNA_ID=CAMNT_0026294549 /DNA_START=93 /DNA_END=710 /DNA_ORIENTATION=-
MEFLLKAKEKLVVEEAFQRTFNRRNESFHEPHMHEIDSKPLLTWYQDSFELSQKEAETLFIALKSLIKDVMYESADIVVSDESLVLVLQKHLPEDLDKRMKNLIAKVIKQNLSQWRSSSIQSSVSLSKYVSSSCTVKMDSFPSENVSKSSTPSALLELKVQREKKHVHELPKLDTIHLELNRESLSTILESFNTIEESLAEFANT